MADRLTRWCVRLCAGGSLVAAVALPSAGAAQHRDQHVGPSDLSCSSNFTRGYSNCAASQPSVAAGTTTAPVATRGDAGAAVTEADVDAFLAQHGKPSREAVRALLDPTDENIAAMARRIRQDAAVAAYVASRLTALQELDPGLIAINPAFNSQDLPWLSGMRVVLHVATGCRQCEVAAQTLQRLVAESPVLDARLVVHGAKSARAMTLALAQLGVTLHATAASPEDNRFARAVPVALVADTRHGRTGVLTQFDTTQELRTAVAAFRRLAIGEGAAK